MHEVYELGNFDVIFLFENFTKFLVHYTCKFQQISVKIWLSVTHAPKSVYTSLKEYSFSIFEIM